METPNLEKMQGVHDRSQPIGEFLTWLLNERGYLLCKPTVTDDPTVGDMLLPVDGGPHGLVEFLLAEYFGVDLDGAEQERQGLLDEVRSLQRQEDA